jgi:catechol 2,3-dioxygenase-like lactoylglutathione lyase family enzyme
MTVTVSDRPRSLKFYQGLFGWPRQHNQGTSTGLRIGAGPQYISLSQGGPGAQPGINHFCMTIDGFDAGRIMKTLAQHGVATDARPGAGAMKEWVRMRGEDAGGAKEGTPELYVNDPDGNRYQLQDPRYCGGSGLFGEICPNLPAEKGLLAVRDYGSFTLRVSDIRRTQAHYQALFGLPSKGQEGARPLLGVGAGAQRLLIDGGATAMTTPAITEAGLVMDDFDPGTIQRALAQFGVKTVTDPGPAPQPLVTFLRRRDGATTPDVVFTDPDGVVIQLRSATA